MGSEKKDKIEAVLQILKKQAPLSLKQEKFCDDSCIERFLKARGENVKKTAKHLRSVLSWRDAIGTEHLMADEFSAELSEGVAYLSGIDDEGRPVLIFRIKQDYLKFYSQKSYVRFLVFTLEVAISSMSRFVDQFVLLFDAGFLKSSRALINLLMCTLKIVGDYYPGRLHKAFVVDPLPLFQYLWKGARPFTELWGSTAVISSLDFESTADNSSSITSSYPRTTSLRFDPSPKLAAGNISASSRFSFTVSHFDSVKPWYLTTTRPATASPSLAGATARSYSFASPATRSAPSPRTPRPFFLQSPFRKESVNRTARAREAFAPLVLLYLRPYDERLYRMKMKPPLGGLAAIASPAVKIHRRQVSQQQRI